MRAAIEPMRRWHRRTAPDRLAVIFGVGQIIGDGHALRAARDLSRRCRTSGHIPDPDHRGHAPKIKACDAHARFGPRRRKEERLGAWP